MQIEHIPIADLAPNPRNARTHSKTQIRKLARAIREFGFNSPVAIGADGQVLAGHARIEAAKQLGMNTVPAIRLGHLTPEQARAYMIADNRVAELAGWDMTVLAEEFDALIDLDIDVTLTGFDVGEIDVMLEKTATDEQEELELPPRLPEPGMTMSRPGDIWQLGSHRILCGSALEPGELDVLLTGAPVRMVFTDPPYNVPVDGHVSGLGTTAHREFAQASGEMSSVEFTRFLASFLTSAAATCIDGAILFCCMDWRHMSELLTASAEADLSVINLCVWKKTNAGMGSLYRSQHELVLVLKKGKSRHINNVELGRHGRHRSNVWTYAGANTFRKGRMEDLEAHPTVKPVAMVADCIRDVSNPGDAVLDPFLGSGTTLLAAEKTGRVAFGIEIDPVYVDVAIDRWQRMTGKAATLAGTDETFDSVRRLRSREVVHV